MVVASFSNGGGCGRHRHCDSGAWADGRARLVPQPRRAQAVGRSWMAWMNRPFGTWRRGAGMSCPGGATMPPHISSIGELGVTATELPKASCRWVMANAEPLCGSREAVNAAHGIATPSDWAPTHPAGQPIRIGSHSADSAEFTPTRTVDPELTPRDRGADVVVRHTLTAPNAEVTKTAGRTNSSRSLSPIRPHTKLTPRHDNPQRLRSERETIAIHRGPQDRGWLGDFGRSSGRAR